MNQKTDMMATAIATIALVVALAAAVMAWVAYDRTNTNAVMDPASNSLDQNETAPAGGSDGSTLQNDGGNTNSTTVPQSQP